MKTPDFYRPKSLILLSLVPTSAQWDAMPIQKEWLVNRPIFDFANDRQFTHGYWTIWYIAKQLPMLYSSELNVVLYTLNWTILFATCRVNSKKNGLPVWCFYVTNLKIIWFYFMKIWLNWIKFLSITITCCYLLPFSKIYYIPAKTLL